MDAWIVILKEVIHAENIYEYDLKGFFDSILVRWVTGTLRNTYNVPLDICKFFRYISASAPVLPTEHKVDETKAQIRASVPRSVYESNDAQGFPQGSPLSPILSIIGLEDTLFKLFPRFVQYADDGLAYGSTPKGQKLENRLISENQEMKVAGIEFARPKCGWVKLNGE